MLSLIRYAITFSITIVDIITLAIISFSHISMLFLHFDIFIIRPRRLSFITGFDARAPTPLFSFRRCRQPCFRHFQLSVSPAHRHYCFFIISFLSPVFRLLRFSFAIDAYFVIDISFRLFDTLRLPFRFFFISSTLIISSLSAAIALSPLSLAADASLSPAFRC
jgi:hypothetical protein